MCQNTTAPTGAPGTKTSGRKERGWCVRGERRPGWLHILDTTLNALSPNCLHLQSHGCLYFGFSTSKPPNVGKLTPPGEPAADEPCAEPLLALEVMFAQLNKSILDGVAQDPLLPWASASSVASPVASPVPTGRQGALTGQPPDNTCMFVSTSSLLTLMKQTPELYHL